MCSIKVLLFLCGLYYVNIATSETSPNVVVYSNIYLYRGHNFDDISVNLYQPAPDLGEKNFDNKAHSIYYNGLWVLYENTNYNGDEEGLVIWRNGTDLKEVLPNNGTGGKISSLRPIGTLYNGNWQTPSLNLFRGINFTGIATKTVIANTAELNFRNASSLIIVGKGVSWTFYDEEDFSGNGRCLTTTELVNYYPNPDAVGFNVGLAASVEKGCWATHGVPTTVSVKSSKN